MDHPLLCELKFRSRSDDAEANVLARRFVGSAVTHHHRAGFDPRFACSKNQFRLREYFDLNVEAHLDSATSSVRNAVSTSRSSLWMSPRFNVAPPRPKKTDQNARSVSTFLFLSHFIRRVAFAVRVNAGKGVWASCPVNM